MNAQNQSDFGIIYAVKKKSCTIPSKPSTVSWYSHFSQYIQDKAISLKVEIITSEN